jgi:CRISPR-associated helicase Cas3
VLNVLVRFPDELRTSELREVVDRIRGEIDDHVAVQRGYAWLLDVVSGLMAESFSVAPHPAGGALVPEGLVLRAGRTRNVSALARAALEEVLDEDAADRRSGGEASVPLAQHLENVARLADQFAALCGLPMPVRKAIEVAAALHDIGKSDPRFQALLHGDGLAAPREDGQLLAKSARFPSGPGAYRRLATTAGLPPGFRHELVSVRMAESGDPLPDPELADLALHLIATHHGHGRPLAPVVADENPVTVTYDVNGNVHSASSATGLERLGSGTADRFWRLTRRYGWWGLAYLEAVLRTADRHASALEAAGRAPSGSAETAGETEVLT